MPLNLSQPILYLITRGATTEATTTVDPEFTQILNQVLAAVAAGIDLIQIREKHLTARVLFELVSEAARATRGTRTRLLVNDRADIAAGAGAHGVHLTTQSLNAATIRKVFGDNFLIGASTHSLDEARQAHGEDADFAVFGPVFQTESKQEFGLPKGLEALSLVARELSDFPVLALGGISMANAAECFAAGARGVAGISLFSQPAHFINLCSTIREAAREHE